MKFKKPRSDAPAVAISHFARWGAMALGLVTCGTAAGKVTVDAESPNGKNFTYIVKNEGTVSIASVTIPHHSGINFGPPDGWEILDTDANTFASRAKTPDAQIRANSEATFTLTVGLYRGESVRGQGTLEIGLADGRVIQVKNVLVPVAASNLEKLAVPVFLLLCFGIFIWRKHRKDKASATSSTEAS